MCVRPVHFPQPKSLFVRDGDPDFSGLPSRHDDPGPLPTWHFLPDGPPSVPSLPSVPVLIPTRPTLDPWQLLFVGWEWETGGRLDDDREDPWLGLTFRRRVLGATTAGVFSRRSRSRPVSFRLSSGSPRLSPFNRLVKRVTRWAGEIGGCDTWISGASWVPGKVYSPCNCRRTDKGTTMGSDLTRKTGGRKLGTSPWRSPPRPPRVDTRGWYPQSKKTVS